MVQLERLRLTFARLLDRGWDARWVLAQPIYVLAGLLAALSNDADKNKPAQRDGASTDGSSRRTYVVSKDAREARKKAREAAKKDK